MDITSSNNAQEPQYQFEWIEQIALEELKAEESGIIDFNSHLDPQGRLEESSIRFMEEIRDLFEVYLTRFNELRGRTQGESSIKIFKISNTLNDFMLFRNSLKLVVARKAIDTISIGFLSNSGGLFAARTSPNDAAKGGIHELKASFGPFSQIQWRFQDELIDAQALVRHYLTEFIKHSAR